MKNKKVAKNIGIYVLIFAMVLGMAYFYKDTPSKSIKNVEFSEFVVALEKNQIKEIRIGEGTREFEGKLKDGTYLVAYAPTTTAQMLVEQQYVLPKIEDGLIIESVKPSSGGWILNWLPTILLIVLMCFFWFSFMNQGQGGGKGVMSFGKSRARLHKEEDVKKVTFADVAGLDEEKEELEEVVDFLKNPKKYVNLGARIPKGILLVGPPGTGKTYLSKAAAGEAGVPFFTISGSDFVEMFVGVGASRVRDLFEQAKKNAPCIVFIDEIDAVGRRRGAGIGGGNDEREQTLNQLLVEMDGFGVNEGIIILAATNRPDVLDPAILRPGRFDREVVIGIPDIKGREEIFRIHSRNKPLDEGVDAKVLARRTPGFTPADIENMLNEAALLTARRNGRKIHMRDIEEAITRVIAGPQKKSRVISENERRLTAFHEAGHAVVARSLPNTDPVHQVTIMPRGRAGGFTMILPKEDKYYMTKTDMKEQIVHLLGGRVAEKLTLNDISTGASNDLERATSIARNMVTKYGMSDKLGPVQYSDSDEVFLGRDFTSKQNYSEEVASKIDQEIRDIVEEAFAQAEQILTENMDKLKLIAEVLLEIETLDAEQFEELFSGAKTAEEVISEVHDMENRKEEANRIEAEETAEAEMEAAREMAQLLKDRKEGDGSGGSYEKNEPLEGIGADGRDDGENRFDSQDGDIRH
ncbi:ATP-dependent zinc metalloprotease FtsH [Bacilliculturomica massiliensis]|uniref:ATP-dependent zinc metalloprotease FtsH n=1 Tax=Bacilliculturomica massiliensis TaxID=1917867 RepID=UPI00248305FD|nr:ATP-dependent zinc metalloprotease FtsH [Bacilliculturomica massiliensis]